jgi:glycosyltransferase involved in cell wall biosynthesis
LSLDIWGPDGESPKYVTDLKQRTAPFPTVRWNGRYNNHQLWQILSSFDALVVPSRWYENSPTVIYEAYHAGLPVIATHLGGMAELVEHDKSGLLFKLNDVGDLRHQITRLLHEPTLLAQLSAGVPSIKSAEAEVSEIVSLYHQLLESRR